MDNITGEGTPMSRALRLFTILFLTMLAFTVLPRATAQDGIPDNCEWPGEFQRPTWFPRYEATSGRLVLVDWNTGADVQVIATGLPDTRIQGWSADCRYLATAIGPVESMATVVWDVVDNRRVGEVPDAYLRPHPITWGPGNYLVVETRNGAILWNVPANTQIMLNESFDPVSGRNFSRLRWNAADRVLIARLALGEWVAFDLVTGQQVPVPRITAATSEGGLPASVLVGQSGYSPNLFIRGCGDRLIDYIAQERRFELRDSRTGELILNLDSNLNRVESAWWAPGCRYLFAEVAADSDISDPYEDAVDRQLIFWDTETGQRITELNYPISIWYMWWSPEGDRVVVRTRLGHYLVDMPTGLSVLLVFNGGINSDFDTELDVYWDYARGQIITSGWNAVYTFDLRTGRERNRYSAMPEGGCDGWWGCDFSVSRDGTALFVSNSRGNSIGVWNLDTLESAYVYTDRYRVYLGRQMALSPDGRYLVMVRTALSVWDLDNLAEDVTDRLPVYRWPGPRTWIQSVRFIDNVTVETESYNAGVQRWNIETGVEVPVE